MLPAVRDTYSIEKWLVWVFVVSWTCMVVGWVGQWLT